MIDLNNVTFTIPFKNDSTDREENAHLVLDFLNHFFKPEIYFGEQGNSNFKASYSVVHLNYDEPVKGFKKCKILNEMSRLSTLDIICSYDVDCFLCPEQIIEGVRMVLDDEADLVIPFDGTCYNVDRKYINNIKKFDLRSIDTNICRKRRLNTVGGVNIYNHKKFIEWGMWNEKFISWGGEDDEFVYRVKQLGYRIKRTRGSLYHLNHSRQIECTSRNTHYSTNKEILSKISKMSVPELKEYIKKWGWVK